MTSGGKTAADRILCAVLASPPTTTGARTRSALAVAAEVLGYEHVRIVNLLPIPSPDIPAMSRLGEDWAAWERGHDDLREGLATAHGLLAAWGVSALTGTARWHHRAQIRWLVEEAQRVGHRDAWTVGRQPRHPSRWHQFVSDRHARTPLAMPHRERLQHVLHLRSVAELATPLVSERDPVS